MIKIWLDDVYGPPDRSWVHVVRAETAIAILRSRRVQKISLDYDLPGWLTGLDVVKYMRRTGRWTIQKPLVHSKNFVGAELMRDAIEKWWPERKR